jgi:hypothetical protein
MKPLFVFGIALMILGTLSGCGFLDSFFLPTTTADGGKGPSVAQTAGGLASPWIPFAGLITGAATTIYAAIRGWNKDNWKKSAAVTFDSIEDFLKLHPELEEPFKEFLARNHAAAGVYDFVKAFVEKYDH